MIKLPSLSAREVIKNGQGDPLRKRGEKLLFYEHYTFALRSSSL
jgi:hypothetical protein